MAGLPPQLQLLINRIAAPAQMNQTNLRFSWTMTSDTAAPFIDWVTDLINKLADQIR